MLHKRSQKQLKKYKIKQLGLLYLLPKNSVTAGRSLLNLLLLQSWIQYLFHNLTHKKVAKDKASKRMLNLN